MQKWLRNLVILWFVQFAGMFSIAAVFSFIPLYVRNLGIDDFDQLSLWAGLLGSAAATFAVISGPFWGSLADRYGRKLMVIRVMIANTCILSAMGFVPGVYEFLGLRILQGIFGGFGGAVIALVSTLAPPQHTGIVMGLMQTAIIAGSAIGPLVGGIVADHWGFTTVFLILGAVSLTAAFAASFVQEDFQPRPSQERGSMIAGLRSLFKEPGLPPMIGVLFMTQFAVAVVHPILPLFVQQLGTPEEILATTAGAIIAVNGLSSALSAAATGRLSNCFTHRRILLSAAACAGVIILLQGFVQTTAQLFWLRFINGLFLGTMLPTANTLISHIIPIERRGSAFGITHSASLLGNVLGPLTGGAIAALYNIQSVFFLTAVLYACNFYWIYRSVQQPVNCQTSENDSR